MQDVGLEVRNQVLAVKPDAAGDGHFALRPDWLG